MMKRWLFPFTRLLLVSMAAGAPILADNATTLAAEPPLSITVSPATTVSHAEKVTLIANVFSPAQVQSYRWAHVGGSHRIGTAQALTLGGSGWPTSPGTRTFEVTVTLTDGTKLTASQAISFIKPPLRIEVIPAATVAHTEEVILIAKVSNHDKVKSYRWAHIGGSQNMGTAQALTLGGSGWPTSPGTRTFEVTATYTDSTQVTARQTIFFINPPLATGATLSIAVSPATTVAHTEEVTLTANVSNHADKVKSYRWAHIGGDHRIGTAQTLTLGGSGWPTSPGARTFVVTATFTDGSQLTASQAISFINPLPVSEVVSLPDPSPAFTPNPDADHTLEWPVSHSYTGDYAQTLDPGIQTKTHVLFDNGTLTPPAGEKGINISNTSSSDYHGITIGSNAEINATKSFATSIVTQNNQGDLRIVNRGTINLSQYGRGLHASMRNAPSNVRLVNYGTIKLDGPTAEPQDVGTEKPHLVNAHILRAGAPHEFDDYSHSVELINMPNASLIATGTYNGFTSQWPKQMRNNGSMGGLKIEAGGGHLGRVVNYGKIEIEATGARGLWAYGLWGAAQAHNFGTITMSGLLSYGIRVVSCAPYPFDNNGCHQALGEIVPDPDTTPGDVYARNYPAGVITILPSTREGDTRIHRKSYGIYALSKTAGRTFAINEGAISTEGEDSYGIYAHGYVNPRDQNDTDYPHIPDYPDTSDHDAVYVANTGTITTTGEAAHGIHARHLRGGQITVMNLKTTTTTGTQSQGTITTEGDSAAGISVHAPVGAVPVSTCNTAESNFPDASCQRVAVVSSVKIVNTGDIIADGSDSSGIEVSSDGGEVDVDNAGDIIADGSGGIGIGVSSDGGDVVVDTSGDITVDGSGGIGIDVSSDSGDVDVDTSGDIIADDIGIDVVSNGGDITIVHTGDITASQVGIRVQTSGQGRIRLQITGQLNAPTPYEVIGGVNNEIIEDTTP